MPQTTSTTKPFFALLLALCLGFSGAALEGIQAQSIVLHDADSLHRTGQDARALDAYQTAAQLHDPCVQVLAYQGIGRIHRAWKNPHDAEAAFGEAMRYSARCQGVTSEQHRLEWALALIETGQAEKATAPLIALVGLNGPYAQEALHNLGHIAFDTGDFEKAADHFFALAERLDKASRTLAAEGAFEWGTLSYLLAFPEDKGGEQRINDWVQRPNWATKAPALRCARLVHWAGVLYEVGQVKRAERLLAAMPEEAGPSHLARSSALQSRIHERKDRRLEALISSAEAVKHAQRSKNSELIQTVARQRCRLLKDEGRYIEALVMLTLADSLATATTRIESSAANRFWEEPFIRELGDARTALWARTEKMQRLGLLLLALLSVFTGTLAVAAIRSRKKFARKAQHLQRVSLPAVEEQLTELGQSARQASLILKDAALSPMQKKAVVDFELISELCTEKLQPSAVNLSSICAQIDAKHTKRIEWSVTEETVVNNDAGRIANFLSHLLERIEARQMKVDLRAAGNSLHVVLHSFSDTQWWPRDVSLFTGDKRDKDWSLVRMRCEHLGGGIRLDCDASGAGQMHVSLPNLRPSKGSAQFSKTPGNAQPIPPVEPLGLSSLIHLSAEQSLTQHATDDTKMYIFRPG
ncbi:MAG: hypothetical protein P8M07_04550 [Flavobacteriales bacterium]|nr:hypothetical protein [Flavobacteriales bacterium]